jgi:hypothetical protein
LSQLRDAARPDRARRLFVTVVLLLSLCAAAIVSRPVPAMAASGTAGQASFTLDSVRLSLRTGFLPGARFRVSKSGDAEQVATSAAVSPYRELSVVAVPFGTRSRPGLWSTTWVVEHDLGRGARPGRRLG